MQTDNQRVQLEKCAARYPVIMTAICEFQRQIYDACNKAVESRLEEICSLFRIDRRKVKFKRFGYTPEDFETDFTYCEFGLELQLPGKGWAYCLLTWKWDGSGDPNIEVTAGIWPQYARQTDTLEELLQRAHCARLIRVDRSLWLSAPLTPAEVPHLEKHLGTLIDRWIHYLAKITHTKPKAAAAKA
jgi:hypothetical protein